MFKKWLPIGSQKVTLFSGWRLLGPLWWPKPFLDTKMGPQRSQSVPNDWKMNQQWYQQTPRLRKRAKQIKRVLHPSFSVVQKSLETVPSRGSRCLHDFSVGLSESLMNLRRYTNQKALSRNAAAMAKTKQFTKARRTARSAYNKLFSNKWHQKQHIIRETGQPPKIVIFW